MEKAIAVTILLILISVSLLAADGHSKRQVRNLEAFTKLYGYVRFFYPSDEAQTVDWDKFAVYGTRKVLEAKNDTELLKTLEDLFLPIAPALQISDKLKDLKPDLALLTPRSPENWKVTCWQYSGLRTMQRDIYNSRRTNRPVRIQKDPKSNFMYNQLTFSFDSSDLDCHQYRLSFSAKIVEANTLKSSLRVNDTWWNDFGDSLSVGEWVTKEFLLERKYPTISNEAYIFFFNIKQANLGFLKVEAKQGDGWKTVYYNDFSSDQVGEPPESIGYDVLFSIDNVSSYNSYKVLEADGKRYLNLTASLDGDGFTSGYVTKIYDKTVPIGTYANRKLTKGLYCSFPLALYSSRQGTYPAADVAGLKNLMEKVNAVSTKDYNDISTRLSAIEVYWNLLQHFYPYWKTANTDWQLDLRNALGETLKGGDSLDFQLVLYDLQSRTKDGHRYVVLPYENEKKYRKPGFIFDLIEDKWIVTHIIREGIDIPIGSELLKINGKNFKKHIDDKWHYYECASKHHTATRIYYFFMAAYRDSTITFTYRIPTGKVLTQTFSMQEDKFTPWFPSDKKAIEYDNGIYQLNVSEKGFTSEDLPEWLPKLKEAKGIIIDWRKGVGLLSDFLSYLQAVPDTLCTYDPGKYLYPDQEYAVIDMDYKPSWRIEPQEPHLNALIVFLCHAGNISFQEGFLEHVKYYKMGTLIGEPTAGTSGNVIRSTLPGGWKVIWTGLYIENPDGTRFHGVGIIPDIIVHPTVKGIAEGRDEILEAGLKYMQQQLELKELPKEIKSYY